MLCDKMKFLLAICSLLCVARAQEPSLSCNYHINGQLYQCRPTIDNPNGFNNFTGIGGTHLTGFADADVTHIDGYFSGNTANIPRIICDTFPNVEYFSLNYSETTEIDDSAFSGCSRIIQLILFGNKIREISENAFVNLRDVRLINLNTNELTTLPENVFVNQQNLKMLYLARNLFEHFPTDLFAAISNLEALDWSENRIAMSAYSFAGMEQLRSLYLDSNEIEDIPPGTFASLPNIRLITLRDNRLMTLRRNSFGSLTALEVLDLAGNAVDAVDRQIIDDAVNLELLFFSENLCANDNFLYFQDNRAQFLAMLENCFANFENVNYTTTEGDYVYSFFEASSLGIAVRVLADNEVQIVLAAINFAWNPMIEIFIGATNNTRSVIRIDQKNDFVTVATPNIIQPNRWNDFRVIWADRDVRVFSGNDTEPFMSYAMLNFFPIYFYGLRAVKTRAVWGVQQLP